MYFLEVCAHLPCKHGGKCVINPVNESAYTCECLDGYFGDNCECKLLTVLSF
ncbi:MAG: hypothetical protein AB2693_31920 [Candidatus Thiodiazotropha sp.]